MKKLLLTICLLFHITACTSMFVSEEMMQEALARWDALSDEEKVRNLAEYEANGDLYLREVMWQIEDAAQTNSQLICIDGECFILQTY